MTRNNTRQRVYEFIVLFKETSGGASPTVREIMRCLNLSSGAVTYHLERLQDEGRIIRDGYHLSIPGEVWTLEGA